MFLLTKKSKILREVEKVKYCITSLNYFYCEISNSERKESPEELYLYLDRTIGSLENIMWNLFLEDNLLKANIGVEINETNCNDSFHNEQIVTLMDTLNRTRNLSMILIRNELTRDVIENIKSIINGIIKDLEAGLGGHNSYFNGLMINLSKIKVPRRKGKIIFAAATALAIVSAGLTYNYRTSNSTETVTVVQKRISDIKGLQKFLDLYEDGKLNAITKTAIRIFKGLYENELKGKVKLSDKIFNGEIDETLYEAVNDLVKQGINKIEARFYGVDIDGKTIIVYVPKIKSQTIERKLLIRSEPNYPEIDSAQSLKIIRMLKNDYLLIDIIKQLKNYFSDDYDLAKAIMVFTNETIMQKEGILELDPLRTLYKREGSCTEGSELFAALSITAGFKDVYLQDRSDIRATPEISPKQIHRFVVIKIRNREYFYDVGNNELLQKSIHENRMPILGKRIKI
ncbi:MAG: hypothetical protein AABW52_06315 [Nanoarchaeota archaeon]